MLNNIIINNKDSSKHMKYLLAILLLSILIAPAVAGPGAGLVYGIESKILQSKEEICLQYGLYNPFDVDSEISLNAEGEISELVTSSDTKVVPAMTFKDDAYDSLICFKAPEIRTKECILPFILCKNTCDVSDKTYSGQVLASPTAPDTLTGSGSSVGMAIAAPLRLIVRCEESGYNYLPIIAIVAAVIILIVMIIMLNNRRRKFREQYRQRYEAIRMQQRPPQQPPQYPQQPYPQYPQQPPQQWPQNNQNQ